MLFDSDMELFTDSLCPGTYRNCLTVGTKMSYFVNLDQDR